MPEYAVDITRVQHALYSWKGCQVMKHVNRVEQFVDINHVLELAHEGPVVIVAADGKEFIVTEANDFDQEVEQLRNSTVFQQFLDERSAQSKPRRSLAEVAQEIEAEIAANATAE